MAYRLSQAENNVTGTGVIYSANVLMEKSITLWIDEIGSANIIVEDSADNSSWGTVAGFATITTKGVYNIPSPKAYIRVRVSSYSSGTIRFRVEEGVEPYLKFPGVRKPVLGAVVATGSTQADAVLCAADWIRVGTANTGTGIKLPVGRYEGDVIWVTNAGSNPVTVYAPESYRIAGSSTGHAVAAGSRRTYVWDGIDNWVAFA
jgi:hypothetical protein